MAQLFELHRRFKNAILRSLSRDVIERILPGLERVHAHIGMEIYRPYERIDSLYFPDGALGLVVANTEAGRSTEVSIAGKEGVLGLEMLLGVERSPYQAVIPVPGAIYRLRRGMAISEFSRGGEFHDRILNYIGKLHIQMAQSVLCNRLHLVEERLARFLLMCHDSVEGDTLPLTQEYMALVLGNTRVAITHTAQQLQTHRYIRYVRGKITILNRAGLEKTTCQCYKIVKKEFDRGSRTDRQWDVPQTVRSFAGIER